MLGECTAAHLEKQGKPHRCREPHLSRGRHTERGGATSIGSGATGNDAETRQLGRELGLLALTALVVGEVIGVGIFLTPAGMATSLGSPMWLLVVWLVMGAMAVAGALVHGELAARYPEAGGGYVYLREAFGRRVAFLHGWESLLVTDPGVSAALAMGLASYIGYMVPLSPLGLKAVAIGAIVLLAAINALGVRIGAGLIGGLTALKLGALAAIVVLPFLAGSGDLANFSPFVAQRPGADPLGGALAAGFLGAFFAFGGWWEISKLTGEARDPERTMPRALALGVTVVTVAYILTTAAFLYVVPIEDAGSGEAFVARAGEALFGRAGGQVFAWIVVVSVLGSLAVLLMARPRVYYAMARDRLFPEAAAAVHPRLGTPVRAIAIETVLASALVLVGTFDQILGYFIFPTVAFLVLTVAGVYVLRRKHPEEGGGPFPTPGYPVTPALFLVLGALVLVLLAIGSPLQALLGTAVVGLGVPVYRLAFRA